MLDDLAIQFVGQKVNCGVHVAIFTMGVEVMAFNVQGSFNFVHQFFDLHDDTDVDDVVEVTFDAVEFLGNVARGWQGLLPGDGRKSSNS